MKPEDEVRNRIRCAVALAVPLVIKYLLCQGEANYDNIRNKMPSYILRDMPDTVAPYFVPWDLNARGKKRVYINSSGHSIRYITFKMLKRYRSEMYVGNTINDLVNKQILGVGERWVIMQGEPGGKLIWEDFMGSVVAIERRPSKCNHPPTDSGAWISPVWNQVTGDVLCANKLITPNLLKYDFFKLNPKE